MINSMVQKLKFIILSAFLISIFSCKKEVQSEMVTIQTLSVDVKNDSIYLNGKIITTGERIIDSLGFVLSPKEKPDIKSMVVFSTKHDDIGNFRITIADNFTKDSSYYVRSIIQSEGYVYYGNEMSFISKNLNLPRIDDFSPTSGIDNEYVKIYGTNFSNDIRDVSVLFGTIPAEVASCSLNRILVKIPAYKISESCKIAVKIKSNDVSSSKYFFLFGPVINDFSPMEGHGITTVTINGANFSDVKWRNTVYVGSKLAEIIEASENSIIIKVDLTSYLPDSYSISVIVNDKITVSDSSLKVTSSWKQLADLPISGIAGQVTFQIKNKIYLCTGTTNWLNTGNFTNLFFEYDITTDKWTKKANFPGADRDKAVGFSVGEKGYVGLGETHSQGPLIDFWEYDPSLDKWTRKSDFPGRGRAGSVGFSYNNNGYALMGKMLDYILPYLTDFWSYTPDSDTWQKLPDFISNSLSGSQMAILNDKLYIIGGNDDSHGTSKNDIWRYDLITQEWKFINTFAIMPQFTFYGNNKCYVFNSKFELCEYFPESGNIIKMPVFPGTVRDFWADRGSGLIYNNKIYYGAGSIGGVGECTNDFWSFDLN
jgi:hypothetical protein